MLAVRDVPAQTMMYATEPGTQNASVRSLSKLVKYSKHHVMTKYKNSYKSDDIKTLLKI